MNNREVIFIRRAANGCREEDRIFVVYGSEIIRVTFQAVALAKGRKSEPFPMEEIIRSREGNSRAGGSEGSVAHDIALELFHKRDSWVFASSTVGTEFIFGFGFKGYAETLSANGVAITIELDTRNANAREISLRHQPREQIQLPVRSADATRIENATCLVRISRIGLHDDSQPL
jgi:hypothetical protein